MPNSSKKTNPMDSLHQAKCQERAESLRRELDRSEGSALELRGMMALAAAHIRWQPESASEPCAKEADAVGFTLIRFAERLKAENSDLQQVGKLAASYLEGGK